MRILDHSTESLSKEIGEDGRISESQQQTMLKYARQDPDAKIIGMDAKIRPVVEARLGGAKESSRFAILAGGRPMSVTTPLLEEWR